MKIEGLVAVVSGGASGLGEATARHLAALGAQVAIVDFDKDKAEAVARDIGGLSVQTDVSDEKSVSEAFDSVESQLGAPRIAVSCAGIALGARIVGREGQPSFDVFQRTMNVLSLIHISEPTRPY